MSDNGGKKNEDIANGNQDGWQCEDGTRGILLQIK